MQCRCVAGRSLGLTECVDQIRWFHGSEVWGGVEASIRRRIGRRFKAASIRTFDARDLADVVEHGLPNNFERKPVEEERASDDDQGLEG